VLKEYRVLDGGVLLAIDGLWYHASQEVRCGHCQHVTKDGETTYYHRAVAGARVIPVVPELIRNEDREEKQDCERNAGKRWLLKHGKEHAWLSPTLLGDDLYANQLFCGAVLKEKLHFIFTCKSGSHPWLYETVGNSYPGEKTAERWDGHYHIISTWWWLNGVPLRDTKDALMVNYVYFEMKRRETGEVVYRNSWITDKPVTEENVGHLASCGRTRRDMFFSGMHAALRYVLHETWRDFLVFITADEDRE
jgi:hypothetical protein